METAERVTEELRLAWIAWTYRSREAGPCRVCGHALQMGSIGGGRAVYHCASPEADTLAHPWGSPEERAATDHFRSSEVTITSFGDPLVRELVDEVRELRGLGEPPVGALYNPHGGGVAYRYEGDGVFESVLT